jgi:hypothetical protein
MAAQMQWSMAERLHRSAEKIVPASLTLLRRDTTADNKAS